MNFILEHRQNLYPIEVKTEENLQSKSLKNYHRQFKPPLISLQISLAHFSKEEWLITIPLYTLQETRALLNVNHFNEQIEQNLSPFCTIIQRFLLISLSRSSKISERKKY